ncbi:MAG: hypothetical protein LBP36_03275 [Oscillospiraceae bacterium]|jgi:hypothetical protein|nr:hypothetical protein [Oscillospiraceae bacterium]
MMGKKKEKKDDLNKVAGGEGAGAVEPKAGEALEDLAPTPVPVAKSKKGRHKHDGRCNCKNK